MVFDEKMSKLILKKSCKVEGNAHALVLHPEHCKEDVIQFCKISNACFRFFVIYLKNSGNVLKKYNYVSILTSEKVRLKHGKYIWCCNVQRYTFKNIQKFVLTLIFTRPDAN